MLHKDAPHETPDATPVDPAAPVIIEYPKMLYHADGRTLTVANAEQEAAAAKDGFSPTPGGDPAKAAKDAHPTRG